MVSDVPVAGVGMTKFEAAPERTSRDLFAQAAGEAFEDASVDPDEIEELFYGNFMGEFAETQGHQGPLMRDACRKRLRIQQCGRPDGR
jgi:acetyl-CoA C-acetyltransferase